MAISWGSVMLAAAALRLALIAYGEWQDANLEVPYTDIDYTVFSDASAFMAQGRSPYLRDTYRYSPLLAFILLPNVWLHRCWGKLLFSSAAWLFNPFTFTIGTRGNCEPLPCAVILLLTICLLQGRIFEAAVWYGLVVHFRIYPVIYALPFIFFLAPAAGANEKSDNSIAALSYCRRIFNRDSIIFGSVSGGVFLALTAMSYKLYGMEFLNEALLYHLTRTDPRHNFSIYFYSIYLHQNSSFTAFERLLSFIPQMFIQVTFAIFYSRDLPFCLFIQTVAFVAFNKVVTAQYFVWFFCLLPLVLPFTSMKLKWEGAMCMIIWTGAQLHWLAWAYFLEFKGKNVFLQLWLASITFFAANVYVLAMILHHHHHVVVERSSFSMDNVKKDL